MAALTTAAATAVGAAEDIDFDAEAQARGMELVSCVRVRAGKYRLFGGVYILVTVSCRFMPLASFVSLVHLSPAVLRTTTPVVLDLCALRKPDTPVLCATTECGAMVEAVGAGEKWVRVFENQAGSWLPTHVPWWGEMTIVYASWEPVTPPPSGRGCWCPWDRGVVLARSCLVLGVGCCDGQLECSWC